MLPSEEYTLCVLCARTKVIILHFCESMSIVLLHHLAICMSREHIACDDFKRDGYDIYEMAFA